MWKKRSKERLKSGMEKFWYCVVGGTNLMSREQKTFPEAKEEAEKLAREYKGHRVWVLETLAVCKLDDQPVKWE